MQVETVAVSFFSRAVKVGDAFTILCVRPEAVKVFARVFNDACFRFGLRVVFSFGVETNEL